MAEKTKKKQSSTHQNTQKCCYRHLKYQAFTTVIDRAKISLSEMNRILFYFMYFHKKNSPALVGTLLFASCSIARFTDSRRYSSFRFSDSSCSISITKQFFYTASNDQVINSFRDLRCFMMYFEIFKKKLISLDLNICRNLIKIFINIYFLNFTVKIKVSTVLQKSPSLTAFLICRAALLSCQFQRHPSKKRGMGFKMSNENEKRVMLSAR